MGQTSGNTGNVDNIVPRTRIYLLLPGHVQNSYPTRMLQLFLNTGFKRDLFSQKTKTPPNTHYPPLSHYLPLPPGRLPLRLAAPPLPPACLPQKKTPQVPVTTPPQFSHTSLAAPPSLFLNGAEGNQDGSSMRTSSRRQVECPLPGWGPMMYSTLNRTRPVRRDVICLLNLPQLT